MPGVSRENVVCKEGESISEQVICGQCLNIMVQPVTNTCPHLFCFGCVRKKLASTQSARKCPICDAEWESEPKPVPASVLEKLKSLKFHCPLHCGAELHSNEKESHVKSDCPNFVLNCTNHPIGCRVKVERLKMDSHLEECHYRKVECEACGYKCLYVNLFGHQVVKRCVRQLLQKQYVQSLRNTHKSLVDYGRSMREDRVRVAQENHRLEISYNGLTPLKYRRLYSSYGTPSGKHASIYETLMSRPSTSWSTSRIGSRSTSKDRFDFLRNCRRCDFKFKPSKNHDTACKYHREPFLNLSIDDCGSCGENKEEGVPCLRGFHIPLQPSTDRPLSAAVRTSGVKLQGGGDFNSPSTLTDVRNRSSDEGVKVFKRPQTAR